MAAIWKGRRRAAIRDKNRADAPGKFEVWQRRSQVRECARLNSPFFREKKGT